MDTVRRQSRPPARLRTPLALLVAVVVLLGFFMFTGLRMFSRHRLLAQRADLLTRLVENQDVDFVDQTLSGLGRRADAAEAPILDFPPLAAGRDAKLYVLPGDPFPLMVRVEYSSDRVLNVDTRALEYR